MLDQSAEAVRTSIKALRSLVVDIYPPDFDEEPLDAALADLVERARVRGLQAELEVDAADPIPDHAARLVYRVAQEGIRNAVNHSEATTVTVRLRTSGPRATIEVIDDGRGFDEVEVRARAAEGHVGLRALGGLVGDTGGSLDVDSVPGGGTTLRAEVPW
jgi:signal transduction histidine kinase